MNYRLEFEGTSIGYRRRRGLSVVAEDVSLAVEGGKTLALVGQSGSGKSTLAAAAVGLLARNGGVLNGDIRVGGQSILGHREKDWRKIRGQTLGYIPQDPLSSLDPVQRIGQRLINDIRLHREVSKAEATQIAEDLLYRVGIAEPHQKLRSYPHELSGGQLQRVLIALAVSGKPKLLIADEPTSALDVTVQQRILDLLDELKTDLGLAVLLITHDLALAADRSDDLAVINEGKIIDYDTVDHLLEAPGDGYTRQLFNDVPALTPQRYEFWRKNVQGETATMDLETELARLTRPPAVEVVGLSKTFHAGYGPVLDDVSLTVRPGGIHALVGESGSGKTTLARIVAGLTGFEAGTVRVGENSLDNVPPKTNLHAQHLQLLYQNPLAALNPRFTVQRLVEEPLVIHSRASVAERREQVRSVLEQVTLTDDLLKRRPAELSGGQRQRVAIARALVNTPEVLVLDEPTSALDVTVQRQIIDLLVELQKARGMTYFFISHDLSLVRQIADQVTVLEQGKVVESAPADQLFNDPQDPYTRQLINAVPGRKARTLVPS